MAEKTNVPDIRFAGFTDPWEQRKLGELGFAQSGIGFPDAEQGGTEGIPFFKVSDMNTPGNERELIASNNYVTAEQAARMGWHPIDQVPAIFFAKVGAAVMLNRKRLVNKPFLLDNNTMAFSMNSSLLDMQFGQSLFERLDLTSLIQVGALPSYNSSDVEGISVSLPSTMDEQRQIGQYLCDLNTLITLHQRKYDKLAQLKKSMLDKMFPKPGERFPEIRFAGFTDPWEQRKFSDLTDRVSIQSSDSDLPQVEYEDIISGEGTLNKDLRDKEGGKTGIKFYAGDVLYGKLRPYLMNWLYPQFTGVAVGDFWVLRAAECDSSFLYRLVQTDSFQRLANVSSGSKMPRADWNLISQSFFAVPVDHAEQTAIAKSLAELDKLITLHQREPQFTNMGYMRVERALMTMSMSLFSSS